MLTCPSCGQENPDVARFCFACATPLSGAPAGEERKVVSVLFADLVGFTSRAEQMDPEDVRALLAPYHQQLRQVLERHGGTVEKFIGDAVVALFGAPVAHEDDPERAVRAALAIRDWVREEGEDLQLRIAVNTGEALIALGARPEAGEGMASGDVVNTAARLQSAAPVNGILVGETTWRATRDRIDYEEREPVTAKGKSVSIPVWEPLHARSRLGMDLEQRVVTPLVGRQRELAAVVDAFDRARSEREPQLLTLVGAPGIGKSRLVSEFFQTLDSDPELVWWRQGRALPYGAGVSFWALAEMVKAQAGIHENESPEGAAAKLRGSVQEVMSADEADWVLKQLEPLVGLGEEQVVDRQQSFVAWRRYLEALAEQHPLVLVFEDLHWADDGLLDFVDHLADWATGAPLLVLGTARPELLDRRPGWGGGKLNATTLALSPLGDADAARVIAAVLDQALLPAETQQLLLDRAGGNPLYAEQFARLFLERGELDQGSLPENVQGIIAARLDGLSAAEKRLLQNAAVLGKVFWSGGVATLGDLGDDELATTVHTLERKGFIRRERRSAVAGETEFAFRHVLVREVAYGQVPRAERAGKHVAAVAWIESLGRADDQIELIAHHYVSAIDLTRAGGAEVPPSLTEPARIALRAAAERAETLNAFGPAVEYFGAALDLWPAEDPDRALLVFGLARAEFSAGRQGDRLDEAATALLAAGKPELAAEAHALAAEAAWHTGDRDEVSSRIDRALELVESLPPSRSKAWILSQASRYAMLAGLHEEAISYGEPALEMATALGLGDVRVHALTNVGSARTYAGDPAGMRQIDEAITVGLQLNTPDVVRAAHNLSSLEYLTGDIPRALEQLDQAITLGERFGLAPMLIFSRGHRPSYLYRLGHWDEALNAIGAFLAEETGAVYAEAAAREARAAILSARGDLSGADEDSSFALDFGRRARDPQALYPALATRALYFISRGRPEQARPLAEEILENWEEGEVSIPFGGPAEMVIAWLTVVDHERYRRTFSNRSPLRTPWLDGALALVDCDYARALEIYEATGSATDIAIVELALAKSLVESGRRAEADVHLNKALAFHRAVGATRYIRQGEALLAATA